MSVAGKKPFVNQIIDACNRSQVNQIISLLNNFGEPTLVSLYGTENVISSANLGVSYVTFKLEQISNKIADGILVYIDADNCGLFAFSDDTGSVSEFQINPVQKTFEQIFEHLTVEELRQVCSDKFTDEHNYALDNEVIKKYSVDPSLWDTTPTLNSTKPVTSGGIFNSEKNIREVAEGKCRSFITSYAYDIAYLKENMSGFNYVGRLNPNTLEWENITGDVMEGLYDDAPVCNGDLNSQNLQLDPEGGVLGGYIILQMYPNDLGSEFTFVLINWGTFCSQFTKTGDILLVQETDVPDRWFSGDTLFAMETAKMDLTGYPLKSENETITGIWSFTDEIDIVANDTVNKIVNDGSQDFDFYINGAHRYRMTSASFRATANNAQDLGTSSYAWKDLYLAGKIILGTITLQNVGGLQVSGSVVPSGSSYYDIGSSTKKWVNAYISGTLYGANYDFTIDSAYKLLYNPKRSDNTLTELSYEFENICSKSADTTFTFTTPRTNCLPEYRAKITNSGASAIVLTFTGVSNIITNDDSGVLITNGTNSTISLSAGLTIECSVMDGKMVAINWNA